MENINEETPRDFLTDLNKPRRTNPNVQAVARFNLAKTKLREKTGGDFWEGGTKENFFKTVRQAINIHFKDDIEQLKYYQKMLDKYEQITPEHEIIKTDAQLTVDKENNKPVNKFNSKTGKYFSY